MLTDLFVQGAGVVEKLIGKIRRGVLNMYEVAEKLLNLSLLVLHALLAKIYITILTKN